MNRVCIIQCWFLEDSFIIILMIFGLIGSVAAHEPGYDIAIKKVSQAPIIDGILNDEIWKSASIAELSWWKFKQSPLRTKEYQSHVRIVYDDQFLYFGVSSRMSKKAILSANTEEHDNLSLTKDDHFAIFIEPQNTGIGHYFVVFINIGNISLDIWQPARDLAFALKQDKIPAKFRKIALAYEEQTIWDSKDLKSAVKINEESWDIEIRISFFDLLQSKSPQGKTWGVNFGRYIFQEQDAISWSKTGTSFLQPSRFGDLIFR